MINGQKGSAHVVVTVILVVGLLSALGFIFWQNFLNKPKTNVVESNSSKQTPKKEKRVELEEVSFNESFGTKVSFSYPKGWTLERSLSGPVPLNADEGPTNESITITSPSNDVSVFYALSANGGYGGACVPEESGTIASLNYEALSGFQGAVFTELVTKVGESRYTGYSGLMNESTRNVKANDSACDVSFSNLIKLDDSINLTMSSAKINVRSLQDKDGLSLEYKSVDAIRDEMKTNEYVQAKSILLSTKVVR